MGFQVPKTPGRCAAQEAIEFAVRDTLRKAGGRSHILNLGHGVLVGGHALYVYL